MYIRSSALVGSLMFAFASPGIYRQRRFKNVKPEDIGLSSGKCLQRIHEAVQAPHRRRPRHLRRRHRGRAQGPPGVLLRKRTVSWIPTRRKGMSKDTPVLDRVDVQTHYWDGHLDADGGRQDTAHRSGIQVHSGISRHEGGGDAGATGRAGWFLLQGRARGRLFYTVPAMREITIQGICSPISGLVSGGAASAAELAKVARKPGETLADYIPRLGTAPLDFQPGSRWSYSPGAGFETLGRIVEIVSGQTFDQFLRQRIFDPLGMKDISFPSCERTTVAGHDDVPSVEQRAVKG